MSTLEGELDAILDPLARATMAAWEGQPLALRLVATDARALHVQARPIRHDEIRRAPGPTTNVIPLRRPVRVSGQGR